MEDTTASSELNFKIIQLIKENTNRSNYDAWKIINESYFNSLKGFLRKRGLNDENILEEIIQVSLAALFQNVLMDKFRGDSDIGTYLTSIATNKWLRWLRDNRPYLAHDGSKSDLSDPITELDRIQSFLRDELKGKEKETFKFTLKNDTGLQELVEVVRTSLTLDQRVRFVEVDRIGEEPESTVNQSQRIEDMKDFIIRAFQADHLCPQALIDYYFVYEVSYEKMAHAIKRKHEKYSRVYERIKKQINRCTKTLREHRKSYKS